jgi:hypothetical protein
MSFMVASKLQKFTRIHLTLVSFFAVAFLASIPSAISAHQVTNASGSATTPHHHVYKRTAYGSGFTSGHVAPTRHGNNMIIWSASPSKAYGSSVRQMQIVKPKRQRSNQPRRTKSSATQLRRLNPGR